MTEWLACPHNAVDSEGVSELQMWWIKNYPPTHGTIRLWLELNLLPMPAPISSLLLAGIQRCLCQSSVQCHHCSHQLRYSDVIMDTMASQITSLTLLYSTVNSSTDQKKTSKLRVTGLNAGKSPGTGEFPAQIASNAENVYIWWRHHICWNVPQQPSYSGFDHRRVDSLQTKIIFHPLIQNMIELWTF